MPLQGVPCPQLQILWFHQPNTLKTSMLIGDGDSIFKLLRRVSHAEIKIMLQFLFISAHDHIQPSSISRHICHLKRKDWGKTKQIHETAPLFLYNPVKTATHSLVGYSIRMNLAFRQGGTVMEVTFQARSKLLTFSLRQLSTSSLSGRGSVNCRQT